MTSSYQSNCTGTVTVQMTIEIKDETMEYKSLSFIVARWRPRQDQTSEMYVLIYLGDGDDRRQVRLKIV